MSKQINLSLAAAGDVAVLRNETQHIIEKIEPFNGKDFQFNIAFREQQIISAFEDEQYTITGSMRLSYKHRHDITDVLRNGASIFETD